MPELAELGRIPGVLGRVVRKGDEQTFVEPGQPAEIAMVQIRGGNLRHPAHQRVVPEQPSQWRQRVIRAGDLRQRVGRSIEGNGGNLREGQRIEVEELNAADREAELVAFEGGFEQRSSRNHREVGTLFGEVAKQLYGVGRVLDFVEEQEGVRLGGVGALEKQDRLQGPRERQPLVEDLAVAGMVEIQGHVLPELASEGVHRRRLAHLPCTPEHEGLAFGALPPRPEILEDARGIMPYDPNPLHYLSNLHGNLRLAIDRH